MIREADADYVLALKGNHSVLHDEVKTFLDDAMAHDWRDLPHAHHATMDKEHGRHEQRRYWITEQIDWLADKAHWEGLRSLAVVEATRTVRGQSQTQRRDYLTSLPADAVRLAAAVRGHWEVRTASTGCWTSNSAKTATAYASATPCRTSRCYRSSP